MEHKMKKQKNEIALCEDCKDVVLHIDIEKKYYLHCACGLKT
jgi:hypothetical protein